MDDLLIKPPSELDCELDGIVNELWRELAAVPSSSLMAMDMREQNLHPQTHLRQEIRLGRAGMFDAPCSVQQQQQHLGCLSSADHDVQYLALHPILKAQYLPENETVIPAYSQQGFPDSISTQAIYDDLLPELEPGLSQLLGEQAVYRSTRRGGLQSIYMHSSYTQLLNDNTDLRNIPIPPGNFALVEAAAAAPIYGSGASMGVREKRGDVGVGSNSSDLAPATFRCHHPECKRTKSFTRKHNLLQHRRMVHKEEIPIVKYRWGVPSEGDLVRKTQQRRRRRWMRGREEGGSCR